MSVKIINSGKTETSQNEYRFKVNLLLEPEVNFNQF